MKVTYTQYDLVVAYVKDELSGKALIDFKIALADSEALRQEVVFQQSILSAVRLNVAADTLTQAIHKNLLEDKTRHPQFEVIHKNMQQARIENINQERRIRRWWVSGLVAAACVVLVSVAGLSMYLSGQLDGDMLVAAAMVERGRVPVTEGEIKEVSARRTVIKKKLEQAEQAFKRRDWEETLTIFEQLRTQYKHNSTEMDFCEAIIFHNKKEYTKSVEKLESINLDEAKSACEIRHFLALSYLKIKNKTKAKEQYKILTKTPQKCNKQTIKKLKKYFIL